MRRAAEKRLRAPGAARPGSAASPAGPELLHELQVHQMELEMQNDELRCSQAALARNNARYVDLYDRAPVGFCTLDADGLISEANLMLATLLGRNRDSLLGKPLTAFIARDDQDILYIYRQDLRSTGDPLTRELRLCCADGTLLPVELTAYTISASDALPVLRIAIASARARHDAAALLRASEALSSAVLDSVAAQIAVIDASGLIIDVNETWRLTARPRGASPALVAGIGLNYLRVCDEAAGQHDSAEAARVAVGIAQVLAGKADAFELEYPEGECWYRVSVTPLHGPRPGAVISHTDISAIRGIEDARREMTERIRLISRASRDVIWDWNVTTGRLWVGGSLDGAPSIERDGSIDSLSQYICAADRERVIAGITAVVAGAASLWSDSFRLVRGDGNEVPVVARGEVIRNAAGAATRMVAAMTDISERLQLEGQLRQSQRLEEVGQLTGGVAHDFNNLLTVILGNADLLRESVAGDGLRTTLARSIIAAAQSGAELTRRLLAFSRQQPLAPRPVDVNQLAADLAALMQRTLGEHIAIEVPRHAAPLTALVDPGQLESALLNLCLNSRDAMPAGGRLIIRTGRISCDDAYVYLHPGTSAGDYVTVEVTDTGSGILPAHLPHVFEPFFTTKERGKGTGLGLAMVYGFVHQSAGHVTVESVPGHGTTVRMYLPPVVADAGHAEASESAPAAAGGGEVILLVEDDPMVRSYAVALLAAANYTVLTASTGTEALRLLREGPAVDLLFTDIVMPGGMNGRELADAARRLRPGLPVLYTSGYPADALQDDGRMAPEVCMLAKPYRRHELLGQVRSVLGHGGL